MSAQTAAPNDEKYDIFWKLYILYFSKQGKNMETDIFPYLSRPGND